MPELLSGVPMWFLIICAMAFFYMLGRSLKKFDGTIDKFEKEFIKLFDDHKNHDGRIAKLEGRCEANHKD